LRRWWNSRACYGLEMALDDDTDATKEGKVSKSELFRRIVRATGLRGRSDIAAPMRYRNDVT